MKRERLMELAGINEDFGRAPSTDTHIGDLEGKLNSELARLEEPRRTELATKVIQMIANKNNIDLGN